MKLFCLPTSGSARVCTLVKRVPSTGLVLRCFRTAPLNRLLHPESRPQEALTVQSRPLRTMSLLAASPVASDEALKAIRSFPSASRTGPSGHRPNHVKEALSPASADTVLRVLMLMLQDADAHAPREDPERCAASPLKRLGSSLCARSTRSSEIQLDRASIIQNIANKLQQH